MSRDWPASRGFWVNTQSTLFVWVNEMDHLRVISTESGPNVRRTFERYCLAMNEMEANLIVDGQCFQRSNSKGYITSKGSDNGAGLYVSFQVKLEILPTIRPDVFKALITAFHLEIRGSKGYGTEVIKSLYEIGNRPNNGDECQFIKEVSFFLASLVSIHFEKSHTHFIIPVYIGSWC